MLFLAEWTTLAAALGGSAIGAMAVIVGGYLTLRGTTLNVRYQEREAWRTRQIEASQRFIELHTQSLVQMGAVIWKKKDFDEKERADLYLGFASAAQAGMLVTLLFDDHSQASRMARQMVAGLSQASRVIQEMSMTDQAARKKSFGEGEAALRAIGPSTDDFIRAVHGEIRPEGA